MKRGSALMITGISIIIINWVFSAVSPNLSDSVKGTLAYVTIVGWIVFFGGFGLRQLDKRKSSFNDSKRKKKSL
jgi:uncharacterized membrane protein YGL010W